MFFPPVSFGLVEEGLYRSALPNEINYPFLERLGLKTIIYLYPDDDIDAQLMSFGGPRRDSGIPRRTRRQAQQELGTCWRGDRVGGPRTHCGLCSLSSSYNVQHWQAQDGNGGGVPSETSAMEFDINL
ncbi:unnamed protein product [Ectocarpus sp. 6 AP-2014]